MHECTVDLEKEGTRLCEEGLGIFQTTADLMTGRELTDAEKTTLSEKLKKSQLLIRAGLNLFDQAYQIGGNRFEAKAYTKAYKAASLKLGELK